ncbi:hypothetical protein ASE66_29445 [Bosea sp. Root483D1]|uniref:hypothetical protein n=1 Tax=Bosea sp. Root483D1 TaxID=1736544 RepID=UPI00070DDC03|nr:hypothetical protein [Bosea sp. Root483D1]KRE17587.1 hypothetical protein ASE66_29445 [Bosea sp. Root483D1]
MENGFKTMSQAAGGAGGGVPNESEHERTSDRLKAYGVDTDVMAEEASERVSELQQMIIDEVRARPLRALGWAMATGVVFGFWAAK